MPSTRPQANVVLEEPVDEGLRDGQSGMVCPSTQDARSCERRAGSRRRPGTDRPGQRQSADLRSKEGLNVCSDLGASRTIETISVLRTSVPPRRRRRRYPTHSPTSHFRIAGVIAPRLTHARTNTVHPPLQDVERLLEASCRRLSRCASDRRKRSAGLRNSTSQDGV